VYERIVFVGLGQMGFHLARHVQAAAGPRGVAVHGHDVDEERRTAAAASYGLDVVDDMMELVASGTLVCLSVPDGTVVEEILRTQFPEASWDGVAVLDFSSVAPDHAQRFAGQLAERGGLYFDAPVTGGVVGADEGTLTTMIGGHAAVPEDLEWVPRSFSSTVVWTGPSGTGALLKSISNMIGNIASLVTMEGIVLARSAGIPDDVLLSVLNNGPARSYFSSVRYPRYVVPGTFDAGMKLGLVNKDLGIALAYAMELGIQPELCLMGRELWRTALRRAGSEADTTRIIETVALHAAGREWQDIAGGGAPVGEGPQ
jgi:3-hydroxyisobutyrate dehydrogenase